ncbi:DUF1365 domain-containing protein [Ketogulonicigenium vulgare]|uniref:DUF1365 domain-containing protein n=1 Tax=Ketogulonicigenium vulgare TaxID=92945 RepID=UPI0001E67B61|nr:DUF1365 domain-containing protein [Ketogulonicigenium vulgare]ADO42733.1 Putative cyclopropane/cyclopropene fatty acid synthesis protein [Ketogulonicigenium vulgare Y25]AOZ54645.1 cyclopropane/cyclopropene fatty acid synthesis protein [Ketogulonicigenium vulgare]
MTATLAARLADGALLHMRAHVGHARRGGLHHAFRYRVDYLLFAPEVTHQPPAFFSRNRFNLFSFYDSDHGGVRGTGTGAAWAWEKLTDSGLTRTPDMVLAFMTQPRFLGYGFNPVSFWMVLQDDTLVAVIAEVNNTFGQRHSYLCHLDQFAPMTANTQITAEKIFYVSPFQDVRGQYFFNFSLKPDRVAIRIQQIDGENGLDAGLTGRFQPLTARVILQSALARPGGALRVSFLILWHAIRLRLKGAKWRKLPPPPTHEISQ